MNDESRKDTQDAAPAGTGEAAKAGPEPGAESAGAS